jgi:hypothetical protein
MHALYQDELYIFTQFFGDGLQVALVFLGHDEGLDTSTTSR